MGKTALADIIGNSFCKNFTVASVASDGAGAVVASAAFLAANSLKVKSAWYIPWADAATVGTATTSATYRRLTLRNGGTSGTSTTIVASANLVASVASRGSKGFTTTANNTLSSGQMLYFSQETIGGADDDDGTVLQAGVLQIEYELI